MEATDWEPYRVNRDGYGLAPLKPEGGWFIGHPSYPILNGPPGSQPKDHPDYEYIKELYGL